MTRKPRSHVTNSVYKERGLLERLLKLRFHSIGAIVERRKQSAKNTSNVTFQEAVIDLVKLFS